MKRYNNYKGSGLDWIGEIPEEWKIQRIKTLFKEINERSFDGSEDLLSVSQYTGVTKKSDKIGDGDLLTNASTLEGYKIVSKDDLVSNIMLAWNGSLGFSPYNGITSPAYSIYRLKSKEEKTFFHYLFRTEKYKAEFKRQSSGVIESRLRLYTDDFFSIYAILPSLPEQQAIASFLDEKTAKIDQTISIKEKEIELLKKRRQILIQKAVTKGLDDKVKFKDSGVEWIGAIPEHWEVRKLRNCLKAVSVKNKAHMTLLSITREKGVIIRDKDNQEENHNFIPDDLSGYKMIKKGQFGMNKMKAWQGSYGISQYDGIVSPAYFIFNLTNKVIPEYFHLAIRSSVYVPFFVKASDGVRIGQWDLNKNRMNEIPFFIPNNIEQKKIVLFIEELESRTAKAISLKQQEIEKLKEYKTVLIDNVVTGKIKVS
ncbi:restriction endonuclease subunit S [Elizabethkingia ursingii]|uniref:restriction endonuclease subunit S n=1 Tax=Elizabethkingia ursingii TaxID=1756150 RepID=UPI0020129FFA|nr:restriction endonuclease subunit S [Elizabethkingia ursingii]MCL1670779.1 restriction endonuclease subunit S [Elizabethkingia ursingii]